MLTNYENVLAILVLPHRILNMFCHSHLCPKYVQGLFYDFSESTCEIVPCCLIVPPLYLLVQSLFDALPLF